MPVVGTQPALFGIRIASYIICKLTKFQAEEFVEIDGMTHLNFIKMEDKITSVVRKHGLEHLADYNISDVYFAAREIWHFKCIKTGCFMLRSLLVIWDKTKKIDRFNLILVGTKLAKELNECKPGEDSEVKRKHFTEEEITLIEETLEKSKAKYGANLDKSEKKLYTSFM